MEGTLNIRKSDTEMFVREISKESPEYPQKLLHYEGMPEILYVRGTLPDPRRPAVAIVGARAASPYGRMQAFRYARRLSEEGADGDAGKKLFFSGKKQNYQRTGGSCCDC